MSPRGVIVAGFVACVALFVAADLAARRRGSPIRPFSSSLSAGLRTPTGRVAILGVWLWLGWHFLAR